jgi:hypothetical protein
VTWDFLLIWVTSNGIFVYPPRDFETEMAWIRSAIPYARFEHEVLGPGTTSGAIPAEHPVDLIRILGLKGYDGAVGWMMIQEMGGFGWEMVQIGSLPDKGPLSVGRGETIRVMMKRPR